MEDILYLESPQSLYMSKQIKFKCLVKSIQYSLYSKEYLKYGVSIDEFIRLQWNISKAQAYRYLLSAKILDQLKDFEIQPNYESLCRSLYKYAKTPQQMKLLWGTILKKANNKLDIITSPYVAKVWKELCKDKKYANICHYEEDIMVKVEEYVTKHSKDAKIKQINNTNTQTTKKIAPKILKVKINTEEVNKNSLPVVPSNDTINIPSNDVISIPSNDISPVVPNYKIDNPLNSFIYSINTYFTENDLIDIPLSPISDSSLSPTEEQYFDYSINLPNNQYTNYIIESGSTNPTFSYRYL